MCRSDTRKQHNQSPPLQFTQSHINQPNHPTPYLTCATTTNNTRGGLRAPLRRRRQQALRLHGLLLHGPPRPRYEVSLYVYVYVCVCISVVRLCVHWCCVLVCRSMDGCMDSISSRPLSPSQPHNPHPTTPPPPNPTQPRQQQQARSTTAAGPCTRSSPSARPPGPGAAGKQQEKKGNSRHACMRNSQCVPSFPPTPPFFLSLPSREVERLRA